MSSLVVVYKAAGLPEAEIIKGFLESEDLPVHLQYESAGPVYGLTVDGLGEVRVCVPEAFVEEARDLLRRLGDEPQPHIRSLDRLRAWVEAGREETPPPGGPGPDEPAEPGSANGSGRRRGGSPDDDREADPAA